MHHVIFTIRPKCIVVPDSRSMLEIKAVIKLSRAKYSMAKLGLQYASNIQTQL